MNRPFFSILCTVIFFVPTVTLTSTSQAAEVPLLAQTVLKPSSSEQAARDFIRQVEAKNVQGISNLLANNVVLEQPYQLPGRPNRFEGNLAVQGFFQQINQTFSQVQFENLRFIVSRDNRTVVVEGQGNFVIAANGLPYRNVYIVVLEMRNGKITTIREYFNPLTIAQSFNINLNQEQ